MYFLGLYSNSVCHFLHRDISNKSLSRLELPDLAVMSVIHVAVSYFLCKHMIFYLYSPYNEYVYLPMFVKVIFTE